MCPSRDGWRSRHADCGRHGRSLRHAGGGGGGYRQVDGQQRRAFVATFLGWLLDAFDFSILTFILIDIQNSFTVDAALAGALGTVTLFFRLAGGLGAGMMADRWGRKLPLMLSILWFSLFAFLSGFSTSYAVLFACRALFGIGMGGGVGGRHAPGPGALADAAAGAGVRGCCRAAGSGATCCRRWSSRRSIRSSAPCPIR